LAGAAVGATHAAVPATARSGPARPGRAGASEAARVAAGPSDSAGIRSTGIAAAPAAAGHGNDLIAERDGAGAAATATIGTRVAAVAAAAEPAHRPD
jgi:hypothetical protein